MSERNTVQHESTAADTFFDYEDDIHDTETRGSESAVTIECLRYLEDDYSTSVDVLHRYPTVKAVFRKLNATLPSSAPVECLFSKSALIAVLRKTDLEMNALRNCY